MHTEQTIVIAATKPLARYWVSSFTAPQSSAPTLDLVPVGWSNVFEPTFEHVVYDGLHDASGERWRGSYHSGESELFPAFVYPGRYTAIYIKNGDVYCAECARERWTECGERYAIATDAEWGDSSTGVSCGQCFTEIVSPHCADCACEDYSGPWFESQSGESQLCGSCVARYVVSSEADKLGLLTYRLLGAYRQGTYQGQPWPQHNG